MTQRLVVAEYIWLDGVKPTQGLRSKTRVFPVGAEDEVSLSNFPRWSFDGSSTAQAEGGDSDLLLEPVRMCPNPTSVDEGYLVLCEVLNPDATPHATNKRAELRRTLDAGAAALEPWFGFEQEYTLLSEGRPLGFPAEGYPAPQGPYYCGVGAGKAFGRDLVDAHFTACLEAGLMVYGLNAEVMPGQWEFQIGYRGLEGESADPLTASDQLWLARWLLCRLGEDEGVTVSLATKPVKGDWNGAGMHTNFSTKGMRASGGIKDIEAAAKAMEKKHAEHIAVYGANNEERLTGQHETCSINEFRYGVADRGASIRIPRHVSNNGCGYLEDRRPGANANPYDLCVRILKTVANLD